LKKTNKLKRNPLSFLPVSLASIVSYNIDFAMMAHLPAHSLVYKWPLSNAEKPVEPIPKTSAALTANLMSSHPSTDSSSSLLKIFVAPYYRNTSIRSPHTAFTNILPIKISACA
jgi:hypothetical protein